MSNEEKKVDTSKSNDGAKEPSKFMAFLSKYKVAIIVIVVIIIIIVIVVVQTQVSSGGFKAMKSMFSGGETEEEKTTREEVESLANQLVAAQE